MHLFTLHLPTTLEFDHIVTTPFITGEHEYCYYHESAHDEAFWFLLMPLIMN